MKRSSVALVCLALGVATASPALAKPSFETFDKKVGWICGEAEGLVDNHCLNVRSQGKVWNIKVFSPDPRGPQESASTDPKFDERPCPHDSGSDDGTWWEFAPGLWVCHHSGVQP